MECQELLKCEQADSDEKAYLLKKVASLTTKTYLPDIMPDFFSVLRRGVRIAVVCGESPLWDTESFVSVLQNTCQSKDRPIWGLKASDIEITRNSRIAKLVDLRHNDAEGIERTVYAEINKICVQIMKDVNRDTVDSVQSPAESYFMQLQEDPQYTLTPWAAQKITSELGSQKVLNIFPAVWLLFFLPGSTYKNYFAHFIDKKFIGQFEYVALFTDQEKEKLESDVQILTEENTQLTAENSMLKKENATLRADNERLNKENATLRADNERLNSENRELREENEYLKSENQELREENEHLKSENQALRKEKTDYQNEQLLIESSRTIGGGERGF